MAMLRAAARHSPSVKSATASALRPGVWTTGTPRLVAAGTSTLTGSDRRHAISSSELSCASSASPTGSASMIRARTVFRWSADIDSTALLISSTRLSCHDRARVSALAAAGVIVALTSASTRHLPGGRGAELCSPVELLVARECISVSGGGLSARLIHLHRWLRRRGKLTWVATDDDGTGSPSELVQRPDVH